MDGRALTYVRETSLIVVDFWRLALFDIHRTTLVLVDLNQNMREHGYAVS